MKLGSREPTSDGERSTPLVGGLAGDQTRKRPPQAGRKPARERPIGAKSARGFLADDDGARPPAIALIESASIAIGYVVTDALAKRAPVRILRAQTASPGKFFVLYTGSVAEVEEAHAAGLAAIGDAWIDDLLLPNAHRAILPALEGATGARALESLGVIETFSFAAAIVAADSAMKTAPIDLLEIRPPIGMGGKSFLTLSGRLEDLQMALAAALDRIRPGGMICRHALIANPHDDLSPFVL
ncbi:MAG: BMC domain-containing protein [Cyanobacteria bacterium REEB65]|nr:BMC domain-containing protein [Cyanobacteria bacterium REEB65]